MGKFCFSALFSRNKRNKRKIIILYGLSNLIVFFLSHYFDMRFSVEWIHKGEPGIYQYFIKVSIWQISLFLRLFSFLLIMLAILVISDF